MLADGNEEKNEKPLQAQMKQKNSTVVIKLMGIRDEYVIGLWGVFLFSACFFW
jgi:hypothetical protein